MIVHVTGRRDIDFKDVPYGIDAIIEYKKKIAIDLRSRFGLKETDAILIDIVG